MVRCEYVLCGSEKVKCCVPCRVRRFCFPVLPFISRAAVIIILCHRDDIVTVSWLRTLQWRASVGQGTWQATDHLLPAATRRSRKTMTEQCVSAGHILSMSKQTTGPSNIMIWVNTTARLPLQCTIMPISHRRHGQDKAVLSCPCRRYERNWQQEKTGLCCLDTVSNLQLFSLWVSNILRTTENCLDLSQIQFTPPTRTKQNSLVLSVSAVWNKHYC